MTSSHYQTSAGLDQEEQAPDVLVAKNQVSDQNVPSPTTSLTDSPTAAQQEAIEDTYWPTIAAYLQTRTGPRPVVTCIFCTEQIVVPEIQPSSQGGREPALKLFPCQHLVGRQCWDTFVQSLDAEGNDPACPFCKQLCDENGNKRKEEPKGSGGDGNGRNGDGDGGYRVAAPVYSHGFVLGEGMMF